MDRGPGARQPSEGLARLTGQVNALGFLLSDKTAGPFTLEVEWIKVVRPTATK